MHCSMTVYIDLDFLVFLCVSMCVGVSFIFCVCLFFSVAIEMFSMNKVDYSVSWSAKCINIAMRLM